MKFIDLVNLNKTHLLTGSRKRLDYTLIGATTENPSFEVISALLSRCQVYVLNSFSKQDLETLLKRAISQDEFLSSKSIKLKETKALLRLSGGDARKLLNIFELIINAHDSNKIIIDDEIVLNMVQNDTYIMTNLVISIMILFLLL